VQGSFPRHAEHRPAEASDEAGYGGDRGGIASHCVAIRTDDPTHPDLDPWPSLPAPILHGREGPED